MGMTIDKHKENLLYIMDSMPDDACGDWRDSLAYAIDIMHKYQKIEKIVNNTFQNIAKEDDRYAYEWLGGVKEVLEDDNT